MPSLSCEKIFLVVSQSASTCVLNTNLEMTMLEQAVQIAELIGTLFSQTKTPAPEEKIQLMFWVIGQLRTREYEWLQYKSGALDQKTWDSYLGVIYFVPGTPGAREFWALKKIYLTVNLSLFTFCFKYFINPASIIFRETTGFFVPKFAKSVALNVIF